MSDDSEPASAAARRRPVQREHEIQRACRQFIRDGMDVKPDDYQLFSFDAAQKGTLNQRARATARGVITGTPDCALFVRGHPPFWIEVKHGWRETSPQQEQLLAKLVFLGHQTCIVRSVHELWRAIKQSDVPLRGNAELIAMDLDLKVQARIARAEVRVATPGTGRVKAAPRFSPSKRAYGRGHAKGMW